MMKLRDIYKPLRRAAALSLAVVLLFTSPVWAAEQSAGVPNANTEETAALSEDGEALESDSGRSDQPATAASEGTETEAETEKQTVAGTAGQAAAGGQRGRTPRADYSASLVIRDYKLMNGGGTEATEFGAGDRVRLKASFDIDPLPPLKAPGDTFTIQLPPDDKIEFSGSGTVGMYLDYLVSGDKIVLTLTAAGATMDRITAGEIHLLGKAIQPGSGLNGGGDGRYDGLVTVNPAPPAPPVYVDNDAVFPDYNKDLRARGNQWGGANVLAWSGQVNYWGSSELFTETNVTPKTNGLVTAHLTPGTKFREGSLYVSVPCFIGTNSGVMGERQIGEARIGGADQATNFQDPVIHNDTAGIVGFVRLDPTGRTYDQFRAKVESYPAANGGQRAYGVYSHADGTETVLLGFGDLGGGGHYYDQLTENFAAPYGDIDIFQAIYNDASLSQAQKEQLYDIYSRSGPSGGAITTYDFSFAADVDVPNYMDGLYENEIIFTHSGGVSENAQADVAFIAQYGGASGEFLVAKTAVAGTGEMEYPGTFYYQIVDLSRSVAAYGKTDSTVTQKGQEVGITFYKDPAYTIPIENSNKLSPDYWSSVLTSGKWYYLQAVNQPGYTAAISDYRTGAPGSRFMYHSSIGNLWKFLITHAEETTTVAGEKTWDDENDKYRKRPSQITVNLYGDNVLKDSRIVTPGADGKWKYTFAGIPKYKNGSLIQYRVEEAPVPEYSTVNSGFNIKNTHINTVNSTFKAFDFRYGVKQGAGRESLDLSETDALKLGEAWAKTTQGVVYRDKIKVDKGQLEAINEAKHIWYVMGGRYTGGTVFDLQFTSLEGAKITIKVTLFSSIAAAGNTDVLAANDFTYDVAGGAMTEGQVREYAGSFWSGDDRSQITADQEQLKLINTRISSRQLGTYPLTFTAPGNQTVTMRVTLIGTILSAADNTWLIQDGILTEAQLKEHLAVRGVDPQGRTIKRSRIAVGKDELKSINELIKSGQSGVVKVSFRTSDGTAAEARLTLKLRRGEVTISKIDSLSGQSLAGAGLALLDKDGKIVEEWTTTTETYLIKSKLQPGEQYTLKEKQPPTGYLLTAPVTFTFDENGVALKVISKSRKKSPVKPAAAAGVRSTHNGVVKAGNAPTGDGTNLMLLVVLLVLSGGIIVLSSYFRYAKDE